MIIFTGGGAIANEFSKRFDCQIISARRLSDVELTEQFKKATVIIHNSGLIQSDNLNELLKCNLELTKRVIDLAYKVNPNCNFINISSMSILNECDSYLPSDEMTPYALSKYYSEIYCLNHSFSKLTNVRFSTIFYKNKDKDGISRLAYDAVKYGRIKIYNNGSSCRDVLPVEYVASCLHELAELDLYPRVLNIASGCSLPFSFFIEILNENISELVIENKMLNVHPVLCDYPNHFIFRKNLIDISVIQESFINYLNMLDESIGL
ncbi:MAG: NAD-dependent epimerase/dehydratase family protein [Bacteroidia bacterium]|nr:NAD-dependent epimerase/dehydratase family protein [Bacteroidia bacterium]